MKIENLDVAKTIENAKAAIKSDKNISASTKTVVELLITLITILFNRLSLNSSNSSKPPSTDINKKKSNRKKTGRPRGGQNGHEGITLEPVSDPDEIEHLSIDKRTLPAGSKYQPDGFVSRQVINIKISKIVTEYRAEILLDEKGNRYVAQFPEDITRPIQYGASVKAMVTHLSTYQLISCERVQEQLLNEYGIQISTGSISNFTALASKKLLDLGFEKITKQVLATAALLHADETSINLDGERIWLHNVSNNDWTWFEPHAKRGAKAMAAIGIIPSFLGVLCHDHWKPYYTYSCDHSLCNAHHVRELTRAYEQDNQKWAEKMRMHLLEINDEVDATKKGALSKKKALQKRAEYKEILALGDIECPPPEDSPAKKGRTKRSKARNLLERMRDFEDDVLRFMIDPLVPFTNNLGERDIRMMKVQQKISGCFRSMDGAINFCRVRSYLSTCKKNKVSASGALEMLFNGRLPDFIQEKLRET